MRYFLSVLQEKMNFRLLVWLFFCLDILVLPPILSSHPLKNDVFYQLWSSLKQNLKQLADSRPYKMENMNDSVVAMSRAMLAMSSSNEAKDVQKWLDAAESAYPQNYFLHLLQGMLYETQSEKEKALRSYESFLIRSRSYTDFERPLMSWRDFHHLRRLIYKLLLSEGIRFDGREKQIQAKIPFESFTSYLKNPEKEDEILNWFFVCVIVFGIPIFIFSHFAHLDFNSFGLSFFVRLYFSTWLAYLGWMFDLLFGLPLNIPRSRLIIAIYVLVFLFHVFSYILRVILFRLRPLEDGYRRCQKCNSVILKVVIECPECRYVHQ